MIKTMEMNWLFLLLSFKLNLKLSFNRLMMRHYAHSVTHFYAIVFFIFFQLLPSTLKYGFNRFLNPEMSAKNSTYTYQNLFYSYQLYQKKKTLTLILLPIK